MELTQRDLSLNDVIVALRRRYKLFLAITAPIVLVSLIVAVVIPAVYRSQAIILIEQQEIPADMVRAAVVGYADQRIQVIGQRVMTSTNLNRIVDQFELYAEEWDTEPREVILAKVREDIDIQMISAEVVDPRSGRPTQATIAFRISFENRSPVIAQRVANELVTLYLNENVKTRKESASESTSFLAQEVKRQGDDVSALEAKLAEFKSKNVQNRPEMEPTIREAQSRTEFQLNEVNRRLDEASQNLLYLEGELGQLDPVIPEKLAGQYSAIERMRLIESEYAAAEASYGEKHPDVIRLKKQADAVRAEVDPESAREIFTEQVGAARETYQALLDQYDMNHPDVARARNTLSVMNEKLAALPPVKEAEKPNNPAFIVLQARYKAAQVQIATLMERRADLEKKMAELTSSLLAIPDAEAEYRALVREYESALLKYREIRDKEMEARLSENLEIERKGEKFNLIEPPLLPEKAAKPNRVSIAIIGTLLALMSGLGVVAVVQALDDKIHGRAGVVELLSAPPLASIPEIEFDSNTSNRSRRILITGGLLVSVAITLALFHYQVRPLDVTWFMLLRKLGL